MRSAKLLNTSDHSRRQLTSGLVARTNTTAGSYKLLAEPMLSLDQIIGKKPSEVWDLFDARVN
jgi:hypothetical protein